ncbi:MAG: hypothetical protein GEV04_23850 [Actinophytocola sp.]|nr:hypothetical protein [Actinophytocola sp.]
MSGPDGSPTDPALPVTPPVSPMLARLARELPAGDYLYEPKWDGFRCVSWSGTQPRLDSRNTKPLLRYFPELRPALAGPDGVRVVEVSGRVAPAPDARTDTMVRRMGQPAGPGDTLEGGGQPTDHRGGESGEVTPRG